MNDNRYKDIDFSAFQCEPIEITKAERKKIYLAPEDYKPTLPYQNMNKSQRSFFDYIEENGVSGSKRYARESVGKWKAKRDSMTAEEIAEMEAALEKKVDKMTKAFLTIVGVTFVGAVIACVWFAG